MSNYWVVGAMWGGADDQTDTFVSRGYWILGWSEKDQPDQAGKRDQIKAGDRIAIKQMLGQGSPEILIKAIGVVTEVDQGDKRVYVDWKLNGLQRKVESKGCFKSIHGPFEESDDWTRKVFQI